MLSLTPYAKNAKKHPSEQVRLIASSIRDFGWQQPIKVGAGNVIIAGHGRWQAYQEYKDQYALPEPWVIDEQGRTIAGGPETRKLTAIEERDYRLRDNKIAESDFDMSLVIPELKDLQFAGIDITLTGFDIDLITEKSEKADVVPSVPVNAKSKPGDLYLLGDHRILCGDSTDPALVGTLMSGARADMVFTDPPYGVNYEEKAKRNGYSGETSVISADQNVEEASRVYGEVFKRISESIKDGAVYYVCAPQGGDQEMMMMMMMRSTIPCRHQLIWKKDSPVFSMGRLDYDYQHEPILYGWRGSHKHIGNGKFKTSIWEIPRPKASKLHPTMKPVELIDEAILNSSKAGDIVLDLFLGSGSSLIAAEETRRVCYGMEIDPRYVDVIVQRWVDYTGNEKIYRNGEEIRWEQHNIDIEPEGDDDVADL